MSLTAGDYAYLAADAYVDQRPNKVVKLNGHNYRVLFVAHDISGYYAAAYQLYDRPGIDRQIVIAERGTVTELKRLLSTVQDLRADGAMVVDQVNPQMDAAERFTHKVLDYAAHKGISLDQITITGHSLGGTLGEIESARHGLSGATFNAYGAVDLGYDIPEGGSRIVDYVVATDSVSASGRHYGKVVQFATHADVAALDHAGYLRGDGNPWAVAKERFLPAHAITNFAPGPGDGPSILTAQNEALAQQYAAAIGAFRQDAYDRREAIHNVAQAAERVDAVMARVPGTPSNVRANLSAAAEAGYAAGQFAVDQTRKAERVVERDAGIVGEHLADAYAASRQVAAQVVDDVEHAASRAYATATHPETWFAHAGSRAQPAPPQTPCFSDPDHAQHLLYTHFQKLLPRGTSPERLHQITAACHLAGIDEPADLAGIHGGESTLVFTPNSMFGRAATVDLSQPAPSVEQTLQQVRQYDQQQAQLRAQLTAQIESCVQQGPVR
ncbi:MAG TPA: hypothetical protein VHD89_01610 [Rhodanobacteraceae bacterium]|nr:hypothetical protein [Rhodanobacteraceae bacterium]